MAYYPLFIAAILAPLNWVAVYKQWRTLEYIAKPVTMLALIWWLGANVNLGGPTIWFTLGAIFCLAGDIFLLFPQNVFIFGLLAFLLGQIAYVIGLNDQPPYMHLPGIIVGVLLILYIAWLYPKLSGGLTVQGKHALRIPVLIYSLIISLMVYSSVMNFSRPSWPTPAAIFTTVGAILFYSSDSILAWDRFVNPLHHGRVINMMTYHLGQFGILLGVILHIT